MARIRYREQDYIYGSVRVQAIEKNAVGAERFFRAAEARTYDEAVRILEETSLRLSGDVEECITSLLDNAYGVLDDLAPNPELFDVLRYPYDCHNIKSAIKSSIKSSSRDCDSLLYSCGRIGTYEIKRIVREHDFDALPENMGKAAEKAYDGYLRTKDPQQIDFLLDSACYRDMKKCSDEYGVKFFSDFVSHRADATNILTAIRIIRMSAPYPLFKKVMLAGGNIDANSFADCFGAETAKGREQKVFAAADSVGYRMGCLAGDSLTDIEKAADQLTLDFVEEAAAGSLAGAELLCNFILKRETEAKNIRIVLSGKAAGLPAEIIKSRLRV